MLGVAADADATTLRTAYRRLIRARHPDLAGDAHTAAAARIIEAYALLRELGPVATPSPATTSAPAPAPGSAPAPAPGSASDGRHVRTPPVGAADAATLSLPAEAALRIMLDAADDIGEITYLDRSAGLIQVVVEFEGGPVCLLLVSMRPRPGRVEAQLEIDSLDATPAPPIAAVTALLVDVIRARVGGSPAP